MKKNKIFDKTLTLLFCKKFDLVEKLIIILGRIAFDAEEFCRRWILLNTTRMSDNTDDEGIIYN